MYDTPHLIDGPHNAFQNLNYYLDPLYNYLNITFRNASAVTFNANFSLFFAPVTIKHDYTDTDIITYEITSLTGGDLDFNLPADKVWEIDTIDLQFLGFRNLAGDLVDPDDIGLDLNYAGNNYPLTGGPGFFSVLLNSPTQSDILSFYLSTGNIRAYNLTIVQSYRWENSWAVQGGIVTYHVFSNNTITGIAVENALYPGTFALDFVTSRTNAGSQILKISAASYANRYNTANFDLAVLINQLPTVVGGYKHR